MSPSAYNVTITGVRNYVPGHRVERNQLWGFTQMVWSDKSYSGALREMGKKFFGWYPNCAIALPVGDGSTTISVVTPANKEKFKSFVAAIKPNDKNGDYRLQNDIATIQIVKLRALSGDYPAELYPHGGGDQNYSKALEHNLESFDWAYNSIVQVPSPIREPKDK